MKDHRSMSEQHRTELIDLLAVHRISALNVVSRATVLDALQTMKLTANPRCEFWVRNLIISTRKDDLSELKTLTDAKGDYFSMHKLVFDDIRSQTVREDILMHLKRQADWSWAQMGMDTKRSRERMKRPWRKILSDVDDTMLSSGGHYPAGIDRRFGKKVSMRMVKAQTLASHCIRTTTYSREIPLAIPFAYRVTRPPRAGPLSRVPRVLQGARFGTQGQGGVA